MQHQDFTSQDIMFNQYNFPQKDYAKTDPEKSWKIIHISEQKNPIKLRCVSVTRFTALFTWAVEGEGCTIVLWDLETQATQRFTHHKKCIPVDSNGDQQLCFVLTGKKFLLTLG